MEGLLEPAIQLAKSPARSIFCRFVAPEVMLRWFFWISSNSAFMSGSTSRRSVSRQREREWGKQHTVVENIRHTDDQAKSQNSNKDHGVLKNGRKGEGRSLLVVGLDADSFQLNHDVLVDRISRAS